MGDLDQELQKAISDSEQQAKEEADRASTSQRGADAPPVLAPARELESPRRNWGLLLALLVVAGAILTLVFSSAEDAAIYSVTTDDLVSHASKYEGRNVRVEGALVKGSLRHRAEPCEYRFAMEKNGAQLPVRYAECIVPDTFRDVPDMDVLVTAEGKLDPSGHFQATNIMAKCPSKYEMQQKAAKGEAAPHAALGAPVQQ